MKTNNNTTSLVAKMVGGIAFLAIFTLSITSFVTDATSSELFGSLKAYAQTGGTNNEEETPKGYAAVTTMIVEEGLIDCTDKKGKNGKQVKANGTVMCIGVGNETSEDCGRTFIILGPCI